MLEETQSIIDSQRSENENENENENSNKKVKQGFVSAINYYFRQPRTWDWIIVGLIISAIVVTIILIV